MSFLTVYNICGIKGKQNLSYYKKSISKILDQKNIDQEVVISSCCSSREILDALLEAFPQVKINEIKDVVPVNVSFNHTCDIFDRGHEGFIYIDSGIVLSDENDLSTLVERKNLGSYAMVSALVDDDVGVAIEAEKFEMDRGLGLLEDENGKFVSIGSSLNLHLQIFSREVKDYYRKVLPDIFAGYCTESVFSFMCAALKSKWSVCDNVIAHHHPSVDGQSSGFHPHNWMVETGRETYDHPFQIKSYMSRFFNKEAYRLGLGFEECRKVLIHDPSQYDDNSYCINDKLKEYIRDNLYLNSDEFEYSSINSFIVKGNPKQVTVKKGINKWCYDYKISVIIPTRSRINLLDECLDSLLDNCYKEYRMFEVILLVDFDDHETYNHIVNNVKDKFKHGYSDAECCLSIISVERSEFMQRDYNNFASLAARGDLVFVLNDDAVVTTKDWDKKIYEFYVDNKTDDDIMLISVLDDSHNGSLDSFGNNRTRVSHGSCFPILTKTFVHNMYGVMPGHIKMWTADTAINALFNDVDRIFLLDSVFVKHNSYHSGTRDKDVINQHVSDVSSEMHTNDHIITSKNKSIMKRMLSKC